MGRTKFHLIWLPILISGMFAIGQAQGIKVLVVGRAVDESGQPISGAIATLYHPPCRSCIDNLVPTGESFPDGYFLVEVTVPAGEGLHLFLGEPIPSGFFNPFGSPPFRNLPDLALFRGIPVPVPKRACGNRAQVEVGDVPLRIRWAKVVVDLSPSLADQYQGRQFTLRSLGLLLRNDQNKIIYDGDFPEMFLDPANNSANLVLPKGKWTAEFFLSDETRRTPLNSISLDIQNLDCQKVILVKGEQHQTPCK